MEHRDRNEVIELIARSTNGWYESRLGFPVFPAGPESTAVFFDIYAALDPGCGVVAEDAGTGGLVGSCFFHPRETHVSLGIMNVHPDHFRKGIAKHLLRFILDEAQQRGCPSVRLIQSALNLDSFSLYTRAGFVPRHAWQDMLIPVPAAGLSASFAEPERVRSATIEDVSAVTELEREIAGISRVQDYRYFIHNQDGLWESWVYEGPQGIEGYLASLKHPGFSMVGPGMARTQTQFAALIAQALDRFRGDTVLCLVPVDAEKLVAHMYAVGGRNCELHFLQVRGPAAPVRGVVVPTFLPESF